MVVTLKQIAESVGVSIPTVSRVLNGRESGIKVREETRQRILESAAVLGYRPNLLARGLVGSKSSLIGVIMQDLSDPYLAQVLKGMYETAIERQHRLFLGHVSPQSATGLDYGSMFEQSHADGILMMGGMQGDEQAVEALAAQHQHVVGVTGRTDGQGFPGVYCDTEQGARLAMTHLFGLGHRRIACVTDQTIQDGRVRAEVYEGMMRQHDLGAEIQCYERIRGLKNGYELGLELFKEQGRFSAIFAVTDTLAIGLMRAAFERGLRVPEDISIIGFDDIEMAAFTVPSLTTVRQNGHWMGVQATHLLLYMIENKWDRSQVKDIILEPELVIRGSTGRV